MKVILAYDGSEEAYSAAKLLADLPLRSDAEVHVVSVVETADFENSLVPRASSQFGEQYNLTLIDEAKGRQKKLLPLFAKKRYAMHWHIKTGSQPGEALLKKCEKVGADLIIAGSRGISGLKKYLLGGVTHKLIKQAPCSVVIVHGPRQESRKGSPLRFVVAYDGSPMSREALAEIRELRVERLEALSLLHLSEPLVAGDRKDQVGEYMERLRDDRDEVRGEMNALREAITSEEAPALPVEVVCLDKHAGAAQEILAFALKKEAEVIVIGSSRHAGIGKILLGSVSQKVAEGAQQAVWIYREKSSVNVELA